MFQGIVALLGRSLRIDSRSWQVHLARVGLVVAIYISLSFAFTTGLRFGAPGLRFFRAIVWLNVMFMTLLGIGFFSTVISEEKEEDTLGLMQMAGINSLGILLGKIGGRLCQALLLIAVQYPFTLLAVTLGGVTTNQVRCAFAGLIAFMFFLAGLGVLCSTLAPRNRTAGALMILALFAYTVIPYAAYEYHTYLTSHYLLASSSFPAECLRYLSETCLFLQVQTIMTSTFGESPWSPQAVSNLLGAGICFCTAWSLFAVCTRNPASESITRGLLTQKTIGLRWFSPGRPLVSPFLWKDFHFVGGGLGMLLARIVFYGLVVAICFALGEYWWGATRWPGQRPYETTIGMCQLVLLVVVTLETANLASHSLHDEIRGQTLVALVMLPEWLPLVVYTKFAGALIAGLPGLACLAGITVFTESGRYLAGEFLDRDAGWFFLAHFALVPNLAVLLALHLRWGCIPLAIGASIGSLFVWVSMFELMRIGPRDGIVGFAAVVVLGICALCHLYIVLRLPAVAAR